MSDDDERKGIPGIVDNHYFRLDSVTEDRKQFKAVCLKCPENEQKVIACPIKINSNLVRHLKKEHAAAHAAYMDAAENARRKRKSPTPAAPTEGVPVCDQAKARKTITRFVVETCQSLNVVKAQSFKDLVSDLSGKYFGQTSISIIVVKISVCFVRSMCIFACS